MKKSASSISLEELNQLSQKSDQNNEISMNIKKYISGDSDSESQNNENYDENGNDENYTIDNLIEENNTLQQQNDLMKKQIDDLRHLLLQVFSDTRSMLLTEDTIKNYLPEGSSLKSFDDHEEVEHEDDNSETNSATESKVQEKSPEIFEKKSQKEEPDIDDLVPEEDIGEDLHDNDQEEQDQEEEELDAEENDLKNKKLKKKKKKAKPKKPKSIINQKGRSKAKKKLKKLKKKTKKKKLLRQLFVGTKGILFGNSHKANK